MFKENTVSILGCGWFGLAWAKLLMSGGIKVKGSCTSVEKKDILQSFGIDAYNVVFSSEEDGLFDSEFFDTDVLVVCIPPNRRGGKADQYPEKIASLRKEIVQKKVEKVIFISSTGVYPDSNMEVDEDVLPHPETESGKALLAAENIIKDSDGRKVTVVRFGGLIGPGRDAGRFFAGKKDIPNGLAPVNLIHQYDCVKIVAEILKREAYGYTFNACAEIHPAKMEFYKEQAILSGYEVPQFVEELKQWKIVKSRFLKGVLGYSISSLYPKTET